MSRYHDEGCPNLGDEVPPKPISTCQCSTKALVIDLCKKLGPKFQHLSSDDVIEIVRVVRDAGWSRG